MISKDSRFSKIEKLKLRNIVLYCVLNHEVEKPYCYLFFKLFTLLFLFFGLIALEKTIKTNLNTMVF